MGQVHDKTNFGLKLAEVAGYRHVRRALELGTWYGGGSTTQISTALRQNGGADNCEPHPTVRDVQCCSRMLITLEIFEPFWSHARLFLQDLPVWCMLGSSVNESLLLSRDEVPQGDHGNYERDLQLMRNLGEPRLQKLCEEYEFDFVLIDGNEYTGWGEYVIINQYCKPTYLAIHDVSSLKTMKIARELDKRGAPYKVLFAGDDVGATWRIYERV